MPSDSLFLLWTAQFSHPSIFTDGVLGPSKLYYLRNLTNGFHCNVVRSRLVVSPTFKPRRFSFIFHNFATGYSDRLSLPPRHYVFEKSPREINLGVVVRTENVQNSRFKSHKSTKWSSPIPQRSLVLMNTYCKIQRLISRTGKHKSYKTS